MNKADLVDALENRLGGKKAAADAIEAIFDVTVDSVNTLNRQGKRRRTRFGTGKQADTKRAIVTVAEGESIDIFGGLGE